MSNPMHRAHALSCLAVLQTYQAAESNLTSEQLAEVDRHIEAGTGVLALLVTNDGQQVHAELALVPKDTPGFNRALLRLDGPVTSPAAQKAVVIDQSQTHAPRRLPMTDSIRRRVHTFAALAIQKALEEAERAMTQDEIADLKNSVYEAQGERLALLITSNGDEIQIDLGLVPWDAPRLANPLLQFEGPASDPLVEGVLAYGDGELRTSKSH